MIHNPWTLTMGNASDLRKQADDLDRIGNSSKQSYLDKAKNNISDEKLQELLDAETWLSAEESFNYGLCDVVEESNQAVAMVDEKTLQQFKNAPKQLFNQRQEVSQGEMQQRE